MKHLHPFTFLGAIAATGAVVLGLARINLWPEVLSVMAYGFTLLEFKKYTSRFQFGMFICNAALLGVFVDLQAGTAPMMTMSLVVVALSTVARQAFMQQFTYVNLLWVEPLVLGFAAIGYFKVNLVGTSDWSTWLLPLLPYGFAAGLFFFGYVQDGLLLIRKMLGGYQIQVDMAAPDFELPDENGRLVRLSDLRGQAPVLLLFVRGDWCPGCHMMLRTYEKHREIFAQKGIVLLSIGPDGVGTNRDMAERLGVNFRLLSDTEQKVSSTYGVIYSNPIIEAGIDYRKGIPLPASFLLDIDGVVRYVSRPERVGEFLRPELVFDALQQMPDRDPGIKAGKHRRMETGLTASIILAILFLTGAAVLAMHAERSQRAAREAASRRNELEVMVEQANDALLVVDIGNGAVLSANARAAELLMMARDELHAASIFTLCPKEALDRCAQRIAEAWELRGLIFDDVPLRTRTGEVVPVECSARVNALNGRPAIFLYVRDIRERLRLQAEIAAQRAELERSNRDMLDSIHYARTIQKALVPDATAWGLEPPDHFVLYQPRDIVSGDFPWFAERDGLLLAAAADCTGHGVPGALMSMIGTTLLNTIVNERGISEPASILHALREGIVRALDAEQSDIVGAHGMDIGLIALDRRTCQLHFAGAQLPCLIARSVNGSTELIELEPDRIPVGKHPRQQERFTSRTQQLRPGDAIYLFTDGVPDQFGGPRYKRFSRSGVRSLIEQVHPLGMEEQCVAFARRLSEWRGDHEQTDDLLMVALRA